MSTNGNKDMQRSFLRYASIITVLALIFLFLKRDSIIRWVESGMENRAQRKVIERLREENRLLEDSIRFLTEERDSLEKFARERYLFTEPGEQVYIVGE